MSWAQLLSIVISYSIVVHSSYYNSHIHPLKMPGDVMGRMGFLLLVPLGSPTVRKETCIFCMQLYASKIRFLQRSTK